ncbi:MAG: TusE/DsrC/DsvC family sulfur relay protein [Gammaproteobacteria bacterium]|nr:TusE/DsrC/DsvC family sulfur relay protein [Gammaproteobacteria bacterium]
MQIEANGKTIELSEAGWLENLDEWTVEVALEVAKIEDVEMSEEHWVVVNEARDYFETNSTVAEPRIFAKVMKKKYGKDRSTSKYIYGLFPMGGLVKSANKIAGLPRPKGCS